MTVNEFIENEIVIINDQNEKNGIKKYTKEALAQDANIDSSAIYRYLNCQKQPRLITVMQIVAAIDLDALKSEKIVELFGYCIKYDNLPEYAYCRQLLQMQGKSTEEKNEILSKIFEKHKGISCVRKQV